MDANMKVMIENMTNGRIGINIPEMRLKRVWEKKGVKKPIEFEKLQEAIYDPGVEYMFKEGMLHIEDMEVKIALGLEPEGAKAPEAIIILTDAQKKRLLTLAPVRDLEDTMKKLPLEQKKALVDYAIENEIIDMDKNEILKKYTQTDIIRAIQLKRQAKED